MILDAWLTVLRNYFYGDSVSPIPTHIAIGTGTTAVTASDTALETEIFPTGSARNEISATSRVATNKVKYQINIGANEANGYALTEYGLVDAATGGTLQNHLVHGAINKTASFELIYFVEEEFSNV